MARHHRSPWRYCRLPWRKRCRRRSPSSVRPQILGEVVLLLIGIEDGTIEIGDQQIAESGILEVAGDLALRLLMVRIIKAARPFRLHQLLALIGGVGIGRDEDFLQLGAGIAGGLLDRLPAALQAGDRHLQRLDAGDGIGLVLKLRQLILQHVAAEDQHALLGLQRLLVGDAAAGEIGEHVDHRDGQHGHQDECGNDLEGQGLKSLSHVRRTPSERVCRRGQAACLIDRSSNRTPGLISLRHKTPLVFDTRIQASVLIRGKWSGVNPEGFLFCSHIDGTYFAVAIG